MNKTRCIASIFAIMAMLLLCCNSLLAETADSHMDGFPGDFFSADALSADEVSENGEEVLGRANINDAPFYYAKDTEFRDIKGKKTNISYFQEGMKVSFTYKVDGARDVLTFMQHVSPIEASDEEEEGTVSDAATAAPPARTKDPLRQEGGVWKN